MTQLIMVENGNYAHMRTFVWQGMYLYIFDSRISQAKSRAKAMGLEAVALNHGPDIVDMPRQGVSLVWVGETPHVFFGTLSKALDRGKGYRRFHDKTLHEWRLGEEEALEGFAEQYGGGIGG